MIFVDTSFFFALLYEDDQDHARAREVFETLRGRDLPSLLVTTDHVVFETITLFRARLGHREAAEAGEGLYAEKIASIHTTTLEDQREAFDYFLRYDDKNYSMVDCLSFVVMEKLGIREALAIDDDFTHRFIARPGPTS